MHKAFVTLFALIFFGALFTPQLKSLVAQTEPAKRSAPMSPPAQQSAGQNTMAVPRDRNGHFSVTAGIGGRRVDFLVDTGASVIALTKQDADRLGIKPDPRDFTAQMQTANGIVRAAKVRLAAVDIGPLTVHDVTAVVMPQGALAQNLLGMSFLSRLRRFEFRTGQLVMEQ
jgi:aspartyl protease family protein